MFRRFVAISFLFFLAASLNAQNIDQQLLWLRYYNTLNIIEGLSIHTEIEERRYLLPDRQHQRLLPRLGVQYKMNETVYGNIGFTYFQAYAPNDPKQPAQLRLELRPHQYIEFDHYHGRLRFQQRFMTEQRFIEQASGDYHFNFRLRILNAVLIDFLQGFTAYEKSRMSIHLQNETMLQTGQGITNEYFDQTRFYAGIDSRWNKHWRVDLGAMLWLQQVPASNVYFRRFITRITLHHYFSLSNA